MGVETSTSPAGLGPMGSSLVALSGSTVKVTGEMNVALRASQLLFAAALCGLAGCVPPGPANAPLLGAGRPATGAPGQQRVAILLPLSGPTGPLAQGMEKSSSPLTVRALEGALRSRRGA